METGAGITGWSIACIGERLQHEKEAEDYRNIYSHYRVVCGRQTRKQFAFLYKSGGRIGCVIGAPDYVVNLHRTMQHRGMPSTVGIIRPEVRA